MDPRNFTTETELKVRRSYSTKEKRTGGWRYVSLLLVNQGLATLAFFGVGVNLVLFLRRVVGQETAEAANSVSKWTGTVYLCSLFGAFLSDSYWGRYFTCAVFQLILLLGCGLLSITTWLFMVKPAGCGGDGALALECRSPSSLALAVFYLAIYMVAFGYGGHQPTLATFGADQFDESNPKEKRSKTAFFSCFYLALNLGSLFSNTVLVYYENIGRWTLGFSVSLGSTAVALASFLLGSPGYRYVEPSGNPIPRVAQVLAAAAKKWNVAEGELYEVEGSESAIKGTRKILHSNEFSFLDKAATITSKDKWGPKDPWRICTVTQVEETKSVLKMLPIWLCTIVYSVMFTQMASLFVEQGDAMDARLGTFRVPAATMSAFDIVSVLACTALYSAFLTPRGVTELQRMGAGLVVGALAMVAAALTEVARRRTAGSLSILWQAPQYTLVGASEVLMYVGQLEFFSGQAPDGIKSLGSSLCMASISLGNYVSSLLVSAVTAVTAHGAHPGWIPDDLDSGHADRFFFLLAGLAAADFVVYIVCATRYKCINVHDGSTTKETSVETVIEQV